MTTETTGRRRLAKLATYLEETKFPKGKFHLSSWMGGYKRALECMDRHGGVLTDPAASDVSKRLAKISADAPAFRVVGNPGPDEVVMPLDCNTVGCAVGWGIAGIPSFRKAGLHFFDAGDLSQDASAKIRYREKNQTWMAFNAVEQFFYIGAEAASHLFYGSFYDMKDRSNPKAVAKRIRLFLAEGEGALRDAVVRHG